MAHFLGAKIRHLRRERRLTQHALAQQLGGVGRAHIGNVETNSRPPSLLFVLHVARLFGVTTDYLLRDTIAIDVATNHTVTDPSGQAELPTLFGSKLRQLRRRLGLSQTELAMQLNLATNAHISMLERGHHEPSIDLVIAIADRFGVSTDYLLWDTTPMQQHADSAESAAPNDAA